jgi:hypothetical protein
LVYTSRRGTEKKVKERAFPAQFWKFFHVNYTKPFGLIGSKSGTDICKIAMRN